MSLRRIAHSARPRVGAWFCCQDGQFTLASQQDTRTDASGEGGCDKRGDHDDDQVVMQAGDQVGGGEGAKQGNADHAAGLPSGVSTGQVPIFLACRRRSSSCTGAAMCSLRCRMLRPCTTTSAIPTRHSWCTRLEHWPGCAHCQLDALGVAQRDICDWLDDKVRS